jgi:hypothetical protein
MPANTLNFVGAERKQFCARATKKPFATFAFFLRALCASYFLRLPCKGPKPPSPFFIHFFHLDIFKFPQLTNEDSTGDLPKHGRLQQQC